jgi:hypothetical protein
MNAREKSAQLLMRYHIISNDMEIAKKCAIQAVEEILSECVMSSDTDNIGWENDRFRYWNRVIDEIKKL